MIPTFILFISEMFLTLIAAITFIDYFRKRDQPRLDIALMFASLGLPAPFLALGLFYDLPPLLDLLPILILLSHPYLILRLVRHFRPLSARIKRLAKIGVIATFLAYVPGALLPRQSPVVLVLALYIVGYFIIVESYVWIIFVREARRTTGLTRHRLRFLAGGSLVLAVGFFLLLFSANLPGLPSQLANLTNILSPILAILLATSYYLGFTPPAWLHRYWQLSELQRFLDQTNNLSIYQPQKELLDRLCHSAVRAVGGSAGAIAFRQDATHNFLLQSPANYETLDGMILPAEGLMERAWQTRKPTFALESAEFKASNTAPAGKIQAEAVFIIPIANQDNIYSLLLVYLPYGPLFPNDDIALLNLLTDRVALFLSYVTLIEKERRLVTELHKNSLALIEARDSLEVRVQERTAELTAANQEIQQFTYIISHDLRSPLVNLKGFVGELKYSLEIIVETLEKTLPHLNEKDRQLLRDAIETDMPESMEYISMAALRMNKLVSTLLDLSRQGHRRLNFTWLNMEQLVQDTLKTLAHRIEEKNVQIKVSALPKVFADEIAVEQIITNLLTNAINYLKPDQPGQVHIDGESDNEFATFHITDNGRGIPSADHQIVFAPFRRGGNPEVAGEGMGLAYVQTLVRRHHGRIWFTSQPGIGSTFSFTLPTTETAENQRDDLANLQDLPNLETPNKHSETS